MSVYVVVGQDVFSNWWIAKVYSNRASADLECVRLKTVEDYKHCNFEVLEYEVND